MTAQTSRRFQILLSFIAGQSKQRKFLLILVLILIVGLIGSLLAWGLFLSEEKAADRPVLALVMPLSGPQSAMSPSVEKGAALSVRNFNGQGGFDGIEVEIELIDENVGTEALKQQLEELKRRRHLLGVVGHRSAGAERTGFSMYRELRLPLIVPLSMVDDSELQGDGRQESSVFSSVVDEKRQVRFLANYLRNVLGEKVVSVIYEDSPRGRSLFREFDATLRSFGRKVVFSWSYPIGGEGLGRLFDSVAAEIQEKNIPGSVLILGNAPDSARALISLRRGGVKNRVMGLADMDSRAFIESVFHLKGEGQEVNEITNGLLTSTPFLLDIAGETAQRFKADYERAYGRTPDWVAASSFDVAGILLEAARISFAARGDEAGIARTADVGTAIEEIDSARQAVDGTLGERFLEEGNSFAAPLYMAEYQGALTVSSSIQLQPIREKGVGNYFQQLQDGRLLYANRSFMYKTNVVKTGIQLVDVHELNEEEGTAELEFYLWFRYRPGKFSPEDIVFSNAEGDVVLGEPLKEEESEGLTYRLYHGRGNFHLDYSNAERPYGSSHLGISFRHRELTRNNLKYVTDMQGMDIVADTDFSQLEDSPGSTVKDAAAASEGLLARIGSAFRDDSEASDKLVESLERDRVLAPLRGWAIDRAWVSQGNVLSSSWGKPEFIGYGKPEPLYSQMDFGIIVDPDRIQLREVIPSDLFVYLAIFSFVAAIAAALMDRKEQGQFWKLQIIFLRGISWFLLLISVGNLLLDFGVQHYSASIVDGIVLIYRMLWWIVPAILLSIVMERFVWTPAERRTGRVIPNIIRKITTFLIFALAISGIIAFVFHRPLTSMLASSGVIAMIIGLAIQVNIANIFSGIVLNVERPFVIGDAVSIGGELGTVKNITWRTVYLEAFNGQMISIPNDTSSHSNIYNYSRSAGLRIDKDLYLDLEYEPEMVTELLTSVLNTARDERPDLFVPDRDNQAFIVGSTNFYGDWVNQYGIRLWANRDTAPQNTVDYAWKKIYYILKQRGISTKVGKGAVEEINEVDD
ncbi:MAG: ABC transporter substrate-binding protein [Spirochaetaceae bacterium]|nr:ABC transporter substrate-binding protein [Spirochaetaceae bacterium]